MYAIGATLFYIYIYIYRAEGLLFSINSFQHHVLHTNLALSAYIDKQRRSTLAYLQAFPRLQIKMIPITLVGNYKKKEINRIKLLRRDSPA